MSMGNDPDHASALAAFRAMREEDLKASRTSFIASCTGCGVSEADAAAFFTEADHDSDGKVTQEEFIAWVFKSPDVRVKLAERIWHVPEPALAGLDPWRMHGVRAPVFAEYLSLGMNAGFGSCIDPTDKMIGPKDALIIVDMQNDFVPKDDMNPDGRLSSTEGGMIAPYIVQVANHFAERGGMIFATRDYHPVDHCSFLPQGGGCPPHCVQGSSGTNFYKPIGDCITELQKAGKRTEIVFKGFHSDVESFGSFTYPQVPPPDRGPEFTYTEDCPEARLCGCTSLSAWTGCFSLKCSNLNFEDGCNINSPPDVMAVFNRKTLAERCKEEGIERIFALGLVLDLCVTDTAINARHAGFESWIIMDCTRPCHIPGLGQIGSGFLNSVEALQKRYVDNGVKLTSMATVIPNFEVSNPCSSAAAVRTSFPHALGPLCFVTCQLGLKLDFAKLTFSAQPLARESAVFKQNGIKPEGTMSPKHKLTLNEESLAAIGIPASAVAFMWLNPLNFDSLRINARTWFPTMSASAAFFVYGGFVYVDGNDKVVAAKSLSAGEGLSFGAPQPWPAKFTGALANRWASVSIPFVADKGAAKFAWINPSEVLKADGEEWTVNAPNGAFVYLFNADTTAQGMVEKSRDVYFAVAVR